MIKKTVVTALLAPMLMLAPVVYTTVNADEAMIEKGKEVAFNRKTGNCLACHAIDDGSLPGNQGPPLVTMKARFPDKEKLKAQIFNSLDNNPDSMMPPFGLHNILSDGDIDAIVEYLLTL